MIDADTWEISELPIDELRASIDDAMAEDPADGYTAAQVRAYALTGADRQPNI